MELPPSDYGVLINELEAVCELESNADSKTRAFQVACGWRFRNRGESLGLFVPDVSMGESLKGRVQRACKPRKCILLAWPVLRGRGSNGQGSARRLVLQPQEGFIKKCPAGSVTETWLWPPARRMRGSQWRYLFPAQAQMSRGGQFNKGGTTLEPRRVRVRFAEVVFRAEARGREWLLAEGTLHTAEALRTVSRKGPVRPFKLEGNKSHHSFNGR